MVDSDWAAHRTEAARIQHERLRARQDAEHQRAEALLEQFMNAIARKPVPAQPLRVRGYGGNFSARTNLHGWYLRIDRTAGVSTQGDFYILTAPLSVLDRVRGVHPEPSRPPMVLGAGGKDGDSIDLVDALERVLPGWREEA